jgi:UDPglucose 6-dehydrogenase
MRDSPSVAIIRGLLAQGARIQAYDPQAMEEARKLLPEIKLSDNAYEACRDADALTIATEWNEFRMLDLERVKSLLRQPLIADLRNVYEPGPMRDAGFAYVCVGR